MSVSDALMNFAGSRSRLAPDFAKIELELASETHKDATLARLFGVIRAREAQDETIARARSAATAEPGSAEAHLSLAEALRARGDKPGAIAAYRRCLEIDPDIGIARFFLAALGDAAAPGAMPPDLVAGLFDAYAEGFEADLVRSLKYQGPALLRQAVENVRADSSHPIDVIDAGCGTGLCAELFRPLARRLDGIDLSPRMIEKSREKGLYDRLITAEICDALQSMGARYDLVLAADVLSYIGELPPLIDAVAKVLRRGGLFAFTAEIGEDPGYSLTSTGRYAHNAPYIEDEATRAGFGVARRDDATLRFEEGQPVPCLIYVLAKG